MNNRIYLDHAATTDMLPEVAYAMEPYFIKKYGNASATYELGAEARRAIELARERISASIHAKPSEIYFTSGGTESDNWAIKGMAGERKKEAKHIITSKIEHHAVLHSCEYLERLGYQVSYLDVDEDGIVRIPQLEEVMREAGKSSFIQDKVSLVSVMYGNNEIGTLQPIEEIGALARRYHIPFHTIVPILFPMNTTSSYSAKSTPASISSACRSAIKKDSSIRFRSPFTFGGKPL